MKILEYIYCIATLICETCEELKYFIICRVKHFWFVCKKKIPYKYRRRKNPIKQLIYYIEGKIANRIAEQYGSSFGWFCILVEECHLERWQDFNDKLETKRTEGL